MNPPHEPTKASRELVKMHTMVGTPQSVVADLLDIDGKTLRKHYRKELDLSGNQANAQIGGALYNKAIKGDTPAMIFWLKTRAGFKGTAVTVDMPEGATHGEKAEIIFNAVRKGNITLESGQMMIGMLKDTLQIIESTELVKRLEELESKLIK